MHIDSANLNNLTQLWQRYGARLLYEDDQTQLRKNIGWPNRVWTDMARPVSAISLETTAKNAPETAIFPVWPAMTEDGSAAAQVTVDTLVRDSCDWQPAVQLTAMALQLDKRLPVKLLPIKLSPIKPMTVERCPIQIRCIKNDTDIMDWVAAGSKAFGYAIDANVILPLLACADIQLMMAYNEDSKPVATGLLFKTGDVVGIHQIGVPVDHQSRGYATQMMRFLIQYAEEWQASYVVLQASEAGRPVYQKLGFVDQFLITYLQRYKS